jgi:hypothetical protein
MARLTATAYVVAYAILGASIAIAFGRYPRGGSIAAGGAWRPAMAPSTNGTRPACPGAPVRSPTWQPIAGAAVSASCFGGDRTARRCLPAALAGAVLAVALATWTAW